jgi:hypothetical protein
MLRYQLRKITLSLEKVKVNAPKLITHKRNAVESAWWVRTLEGGDEWFKVGMQEQREFVLDILTAQREFMQLKFCYKGSDFLWWPELPVLVPEFAFKCRERRVEYATGMMFNRWKGLEKELELSRRSLR